MRTKKLAPLLLAGTLMTTLPGTPSDALVETPPESLPGAGQLVAGTALNPVGGSNDASVIDVMTGTAEMAFANPVWGATYDVAGQRRVLFTSEDTSGVGGASLWAWSPRVEGPGPIRIGTIVDAGDTPFRIDGLAISGGTLYGSRASGMSDGIYTLTETAPGTYTADLVLPTTDSISGIDADPTSGTIYGVDDTTQNLVEIDVGGGTITPVAAYPDANETDLDGLAVGGGRAYLIPDDNTPGLIYVYDLAAGSFSSPLPAPWGATADTFSGGALVVTYLDVFIADAPRSPAGLRPAPPRRSVAPVSPPHMSGELP